MQNSIIDPWHLSEIELSPLCVHHRNNRGQVAAWVRNAFDQFFADDEERGACLYWTWAGCQILRRCGYRAILQAGSASWPIQEDQGNNPTHFSYMWQPNHPDSAPLVAAGALPECHVWIGLPDEGEIVDFSTGSLRQICERKHGLKWELPDPPSYIWCKPHKLPDEWIYRPHMSAIRYVLEMLERDSKKDQNEQNNSEVFRVRV